MISAGSRKEFRVSKMEVEWEEKVAKNKHEPTLFPPYQPLP